MFRRQTKPQSDRRRTGQHSARRKRLKETAVDIRTVTISSRDGAGEQISTVREEETIRTVTARAETAGENIQRSGKIGTIRTVMDQSGDNQGETSL